jgi:hypothetical protein
MINGVPVLEAAEDLGLSEQRVRSLISSGLLEAEKVGGRWIVSLESLHRRKDRKAQRGRPLSSENAWGYLFLLSGEDPPWLSPWSRSRLQQRLPEDLPHLQALERRARSTRYYGHPGILSRLYEDDRLVRSGVSAARSSRIGAVAPGVVEGYVRSQDVPALLKKYKLSNNEPANVILHVVSQFWPFEDQRVAPVGVVAWDLFDSGNARLQREGKSMLRRLLAKHR